jgi:1-aminocyclopropane-1-carboxylate deaminase/D-cysteine desulfhydrase-like pyridoxal-dependent ACC family enzyme
MLMTGFISRSELRERLDVVPRIKLATLPTPLVEAPGLSSALGGPRIVVKRDDLTGLAFGGNKVREFEYSIAQAVDSRCDVLFNAGGAQSNQSRLTAAAAAKLGLRCVILAETDGQTEPGQGNLLLCRLLGATIVRADYEHMQQTRQDTLSRLAAEGHKVFDTGYDGTTLRTIAYVDGFLELWDQLEARDLRPDALYVCTGVHTHAGLMLGAKALGIDLTIVGIPYSVRYTNEQRAKRVADSANHASQALDLGVSFDASEVEVHVEYAGQAHGTLSSGARDAIHLAARSEGLMLDPLYTGKVMRGLMGHIADGRFDEGQSVVFMHTGGTPILFAFRKDL